MLSCIGDRLGLDSGRVGPQIDHLAQLERRALRRRRRTGRTRPDRLIRLARVRCAVRGFLSPTAAADNGSDRWTWLTDGEERRLSHQRAQAREAETEVLDLRARRWGARAVVEPVRSSAGS